MEPYRVVEEAQGGRKLLVPYRGARLLAHPIYNKGTAFTPEERVAFGLDGLLPSAVGTIDRQAVRAHESIRRKEDPLEKYIGLSALQDRNETLFYRVLLDHIEELLPIVYTPTVGRACQRYSHIYRRGRGLWITPEHAGRIDQVLGNAPFDDVRLLVVTDNERILGLGDLGAGGMGIPIGKLAIYTAAAGIHPTRTLPLSFDVGTDNQALLDDPLYIGYRQRRLRGPAYDALLDELVHAIRRRFPRALVQWEDFKKGNAFRVLDRHRATLPSFNDDIEGTAAVALAGMLTGARITGIPLTQQRIVILGAGAAGVGIARLIRAELERAGLAGPALTAAIACLDSGGLLVDDRRIDDEHKREFTWPADLARAHGLADGPRDLAAVVSALRPTALLGTSGEPGTFPEPIIRAMAAATRRPVIMPMSNPSDLSEARPADVITWTDGRALLGTGSPFHPVPFGNRTIRIGQANNAFIFPGVGLGALVSEARQITQTMFLAAAERLAAEVDAHDLAAGCLFPSVAHLRRVTVAVAASVARAARDAGVAARPLDDAAIPAAIAAAMWEPSYLPMEPA
ncbi:NAD-dependent malic enzyme [Chondromyces apiculatus]|uniref:NAD-dependent malic enzyme n=1 Tax=Chondromyces apiculatus DSM 436 TaxID=1192034 RepID=A0A017T3D0_9BACT|nr:NAD-dependent malic enzyme [Chondromyces apiculatus]EYF03748.1 NAD-dependent malic enzyme [Chondromyces apiculatus DSM 436]